MTEDILSKVKQVTHLLAENENQLYDFLDKYRERAKWSMDIETTAENYPVGKLSGLSMYAGGDTAIFVPSNIVEKSNFLKTVNTWDHIRWGYHNAAYDLVYLYSLGFDPTQIEDSYIMALLLQYQSAGLKELSLEHKISDISDVMSYKNLMAKVNNTDPFTLDTLAKEDPTVMSFSRIDLKQYPEAIKYACNDSIFQYYLSDMLFNELLEKTKHKHPAKLRAMLECQYQTIMIMSRCSAEGYIVDKKLLTDGIDAMETRLANEEESLIQQMRKDMGWCDESAQEVKDTTTSSNSQMSLFDVLGE